MEVLAHDDYRGDFGSLNQPWNLIGSHACKAP
jgi:hypothetical protein